MKTVACYSIKGGVGKTAAAVNVAHIAATRGWRTLLWDLDPQGAASFYFRVRNEVDGGAKKVLGAALDEKRKKRARRLASHLRGTDYPGLDLFPADFSYRNLDRLLAKVADGPARRRVLGALAEALSPGYDLLVFDCPPSISSMSENVFTAADALLVPVVPTTLSTNTYAQLAAFLDRGRYRHLIRMPFFSMAEPRKRMHAQTLEHWRPPDGAAVVASVPAASVVEQMGERRQPVGAYAPRSPASAAFERLTDAVVGRLLCEPGAVN